MVAVALSIGSNINPVQNFSHCLDALLLLFKDLEFSSVFESESVGFEGDNFLNMVVTLDTELPLQDLINAMKKIEDKSGRDRSQKRFSGRTLDIDILTYGDSTGAMHGIELPRPEITENAFVLWPLAQVAGSQKHPILKRTYAELWQAYDKDRQKLWPVDFNWHGKVISSRLRN